MPDTRTYAAPWLQVDHLVGVLDKWLSTQEFETQVLPTPGGKTLQARKTKFLQHGVALTIMVAKHEDNVQVQVGTGKWALHAVEGVAALVLFWPLMAIPAWAAYRLKETMDDTWQYVEQYIRAEGDVPVFGGVATSAAMRMPDVEPEEAGPACVNCGEPISAGAKFCANCGAKQQTECPECGQTLRADAKFCESCGAKIGASQA